MRFYELSKMRAERVYHMWEKCRECIEFGFLHSANSF